MARRQSLLALILTVGAIVGGPASRAAAAHPTLAVHPGRVRIGGRVQITARGLAPGHFFTLMFAVSHDPKHHQARMLGLFKSNARGSIVASIKLPLASHCGPAQIIAFTPGSKTLIRGKVTLTGCSGAGTTKAPPPPPSQKKKKPSPASTPAL